MSITTTEALMTMFKNIVGEVNNPDMLARYNPGMEVQINVMVGDGEAVAGRRNTWSDGIQTWHHIRLPKNANTIPENNDYQLGYSIYEKAEYIGMTGWDFQNLRSRFVGFDFDSITGHAAGVGIDEQSLTDVREAAKEIDWVEVRRSTSGSGLHLYVYISDGIATKTHTEHAAIGRTILGLMSTAVGFDFAANIDACGGNMWVWSQKSTKKNRGLELIKPAERNLTEADLPTNWRQNIDVVSRKRSKVRVSNVEGENYDSFETLANARKLVPLEARHKEIIDALSTSGCSTVWIQDYYLLQSHTTGLAKVHAELGLEGFFNTTSEGTDPGTPNCFLFPLPGGSWKVYRFSPGIVEDPMWYQDGTDWTSCYYNQKPGLETAAQAAGGVRLPNNKGYEFSSAKDAEVATEALGQKLDLPEQFQTRPAVLVADKSGKVIVKVERNGKGEKPPQGWSGLKKDWIEKVLNVKADNDQEALNFYAYDDTLRNMTTPNNDDAGWVIKTAGGDWVNTSKDNVKSTLSVEHTSREVDILLGSAIYRPWRLVHLPFHEEYPGDRQWNYKAPQIRYAPSTDDELEHPYWDRVMDHCGADLTPSIKINKWCQAAGIQTGGEYMRLWLASMIRFPFEPLPYLFLYGPQNSGKSILHEAISLLINGGVTKADNALSTRGDFNGELSNSVLAVIEETDLSVSGQRAYNRIKDWVTSRTISIRKMRTDAYIQRNSLHFIQCANDIKSCPIFFGDTRITISYVAPLHDEIPKAVLLDKLVEEAPHFMRTLMDAILPESEGRMRIPVLFTHNKQVAEEMSRTPLESFLFDNTHYVPGASISVADFYGEFHKWLPLEDKTKWTKHFMVAQLPQQYPVGKQNKNMTCIGNISWDKQTSDVPALISDRGRLLPNTEFNIGKMNG